MLIVTCKGVRFCSQTDEAAFFHFANSIKAVRRVEGLSDAILLHISSRPSKESVHDLLALFRRYHISNKAQLRPFTDTIGQPK